MNINWKLRLQNKPTLAALFGVIITFVYQICGIFGIVPPISQETAIQFLGLVLNLLLAFGVIVDPTTNGASDSCRALEREKPAPNVNDEGGDC